MDFSVLQRAVEQLGESWRALSAAGAANFRARRWRAQREAMGARVALGEAAVEAMVAAAPAGEWAAHWGAVCALVEEAGAVLPAPFADALLFALSQRVLAAPDHRVLGRIPAPGPAPAATVAVAGSAQTAARALVAHLAREQPLADEEADAIRLAAGFAKLGGADGSVRGEFLPMLFYRNQHAYLFGRLGRVAVCVPLVQSDGGGGARVDAFLQGETALTRVVEFSRSPFLAECPDPAGVVGFLCDLLPRKDPAQLAMNLGFRLWGEALLVRLWEDYLAGTTARLAHAPGTPGLVMLAFCVPDFPVVFKVVRDRPRPPKSINREGVMERYAFVTRQDRVGRMADAHRFRAWRFPRSAFEPALWEELVREARDCLVIGEDEVIVHDLITERQLEPLNLRLREERPGDLPDLVLDYGSAIKEMAMSNIFPGDLLLKNFGVTPLGRVVFYDYDEVCALTECVFRRLPVARHDEDEMGAEPWFHVGPNDVFPEEFERFIVPSGAAAAPFVAAHADLFTPEFWQHWKSFHEAGGMVDLQPY